MKQHFRLILKDEGQDVYVPRKSQSWGYRYGPTIMTEGNVAEAWFASPGDGYEADWFTYRRSEDAGRTWTEERVVMTPVPNSMDWFSVCDPAVIRYGQYYYIGYTSTAFSNNGGVCNNGFIARSTSPTGPFERWNGSGWGETCPHDPSIRWPGDPAPVIYFDEDWHNWGAGEFSFVIKDDTIYVYYTWTSKDRDGKPIHETRVATADVTDENWPGSLTQHGAAVVRPNGGNDSYDVVYCEDLEKFVALSTDRRFTEDSVLAVYESDDGLRFTRVNEIKEKTGWMCHNCGISGDAQHHIRKGDTMLLGYAYGNQWGCWGTRFHAYDFEGMDEPFYSEADKENVHRSIEKWDDPADYSQTGLFLTGPHFLRVGVGSTVKIPMGVLNVTYSFREPLTEVAYSGYDKEIVEITDGTLTARAPGMTYVTAATDDLRAIFAVYVTADEPRFPLKGYAYPIFRPYPDKEITSFTPIHEAYTVSLSKRELKQLRGIAVYDDESWFELAGEVDRVTYVSRDPGLFTVDKDGHVLPTGKTGTGTALLTAGGISFEVPVTITD